MSELHGHEEHPHGEGIHGRQLHGSGPVVRLVKNLTSEIAGQLLALATSALGLVAALAWNEAVQAFFKEYIPSASGVTAKFIYALLVSLAVIFITVNLTRLAKLARKNENTSGTENDRLLL